MVDMPLTKSSPKILSNYLNLSFGVLKFMDFSMGFPYYVDDAGVESMQTHGIGDMTASLKIQYPPYSHSKVFDVAYFGNLSLPTGDKSKGIFPRRSYYIPLNKKYIAPGSGEYYYQPDSTGDIVLDTLNPGLYSTDKANGLQTFSRDYIDEYFYTANSPTFNTSMLMTLDAGEINPEVPLRFHLNFGATWVSHTNLDNVFTAGMGLEYTPHEIVTIFTDFNGETRMKNMSTGFKVGEDPLYLTPGVRINTPAGVHILLGFDIGMASTDDSLVYRSSDKEEKLYVTHIMPKTGASFSLNWSGFIVSQDTDKDGIPDKDDACPNVPEDIDGFEDSDGCPDEDNDKDGIPDSKDQCPNQPEDLDGFEDDDGCPDPDNDKDGIPDKKDKCPARAEDLDGFEDDDGCPDIDNDQDGIPDSLDKCPMDPEDKDGFQDEDGCPDLDNDQDGIPDSLDKCPNKPENFNGFQDEDGCPDKKVAEPKTSILKGVQFKTGTSELTFEARQELEGLVNALKVHKNIVLEIRGYTDSRGRKWQNQKLSQKRANSVKSFLVAKGINPARLSAKGYGEENPIASNRTADGRRKNRRIEIYRLK